MRKTFGRTCLFFLACTFLSETNGFFTHGLNLAIGLAFMAALAITYFPLARGRMNLLEIVGGAALMAAAVAAMPVSEHVRVGALALFVLGLWLLTKGLGRPAAELPLFAAAAGAYAVYAFLFAADAKFAALVTSACFGFSHAIGAITAWLPGPKAMLGPAFLGAGTIAAFMLFFIVGSFFLTGHAIRRLAKALGAMVAITAVYVVVYTYLPAALDFQIKKGPVPSEAEINTTRQAREGYRAADMPRTESEKATRVILSGSMLTLDGCVLWAPMLLTLGFLVPAYFFLKGAEIRPLPILGAPYLAAGAAALLLAVGIIETARLRVPREQERIRQVSEKRVAFYSHGFLNWARANFNSFGARSSGMFGNLPDFVELMGFRQPTPYVFDGIKFTATKADLVAYARQRQAPDRVLEVVEKMPDITYTQMSDITAAAGGAFDRTEAGYANCGALITEIDEQSLRGVDILMLLNTDDFLNYEKPAFGVAPSKAYKARTEALAACRAAKYPLAKSGLVAAAKDASESAAAALEWLPEREYKNAEEVETALILAGHREALETIWKFVADGGSLLVIGDHTFIKDQKMPGGKPERRLWLNEVLEPFDIKFVNDSAKYFIGGWLQSMENPLHPLTIGIGDDQNEVGMVVGASLAVRGAARPVIVGKYGFLDAGDYRDSGRGYLGNLDFDMGEPMGQVIIAAEQRYGKGKVIVFGDTSAFANGIITNTGEFINRVFTHLALGSGHKPSEYEFNPASVRPPTDAGLTVLAMVLLAGAAVCLVLSGGHLPLPAAGFVLGLLIVAQASELAVPLGYAKPYSANASRLRLAYVDAYHMPKVSNEGWRDDSMTGLYANLMRNGFYTQNLKSFDLKTLQRAELLVVVAPSVEFSARDVRVVREYVDGGGTVILSSGYEDIAATRRLLAEFRMDIPYTPLGRFMIPVPQAGNQYVRFWRIWPIVSEISGSIKAVSADGTVKSVSLLTEGGTYDVVLDETGVRLGRELHGKSAEVKGVIREKVNKLEFVAHDFRPGKAAAGPAEKLELVIPYEPFPDMDPKLRSAITAALGGMNYPAMKTRLIEHAQKQAAAGEAIRVLQQLPDRAYGSMTDILVSLANPNVIEAALATLEFPANKAVLLEHAQNKAATDEAVHLLQQLPERSYHSTGDVLRAAGQQSFNLAVKRSTPNGGGFILVADSNIWTNKNLEREETYDKESIFFMKWLLERFVPPTPQRDQTKENK